jgi:Flp pilus assembly protein TadD
MPSSPSSSSDILSNLIRRETLRLGLLIVVAVAAFLLTRAVAESNREMHLATAAEWYRRGQEAFADGRLDEAVDAFRRASIRKRDDKEYALALGRSLARNGQDAAASRTLLALRQTAPEDADINLELARIAAVRPDIATAVRYYYNALYAPWTTPDEPRAIRFELIDFLLANGQDGLAQSELLAVTTDLPEDPSLSIRVGHLFLNVGNAARALDQYTRALRLDPESEDAQAGAGIASFELGEYIDARRYFRQLPDGRNDLGERPEIANLVISGDPLAPRLGAAERRRRLQAGVSYAQQRLDACIEQIGGDPSPGHAALQEELTAFVTRLRPAVGGDADTLEAGLDLVARIVGEATAACGGSSTPMDEALQRIARRYGAPAA